MVFRKIFIRVSLLTLLGLIGLSTLAYAHESGGGTEYLHRTTQLVFQLGVIIIVAWAGGVLFHKLGLQTVLGEIVAGVIIGPYALGQISFPGFPHGFFPLEGQFPVSIELYSFITVASVILLFLVGLETEFETFVRFSFAGSMVGIFGVIFSFLAGAYVGVLMSYPVMGEHYGLLHPVPLFMGVISTATSVGISARILSDRRKIDSPQGVTILAAAVIDDILGIIILAVVIGMSGKEDVGLWQIIMIAVKAIAIWFAFTLVCLYYSRRLSQSLKMLKDRDTIALISFALALILAAIFEKSGLAMIIGAYVLGLSFSRTDLAFIIQERLDPIKKFLVPVFFCVMGMLINLQEMGSLIILEFGAIFILFAVLGKLIGCCIPALFLNFNTRGALSIGVGMVPRGEVALIVAGIGLSMGIIGDEVFSLAIIMTFVTTLIAPPVLDKLIQSDKPVLRKKIEGDKVHERVDYDMPNEETAELFLNRVISSFENEGFFVFKLNMPVKMYHIRKDTTFLTFKYTPQKLTFICEEEDVSFINLLFQEVVAELRQVVQNAQIFSSRSGGDSENIHHEGRTLTNITSATSKLISLTAVEANLKGNDKTSILNEMVDLLKHSGKIDESSRDIITKELIARESVSSTGMENGIAIPHVKTICIDEILVSVGLKKEGIDFESLDKKPSQIFILILAPKDHPDSYLETLTVISRFLANEQNRKEILDSKNNWELYRTLTKIK